MVEWCTINLDAYKTDSYKYVQCLDQENTINEISFILYSEITKLCTSNNP